MNQLTKYLISELIDGKKVTAVYGGEFKPPTKEHFDIVKKTLKDNKQIDKVVIFVGDKVEEGITQEQSLQVWGLFKEILGDKIEIIPSSQPLNDIKTYIEDNPNDVNFKMSFDKGINSIGARKALKSRNKEEFLTYLPEEMPDSEKESTWDIFEEVILKEGDPKTGTGKKPKGSSRRLYTDEDPTDTVTIKFSSKQDIIDTLSKTSFKSKPHNRQSQIINVIHQRVRVAYQRAKDPEVKRRLKIALEYAEQRKEASKEKTQHLNKLNEIDISKYIGSWVDTKKLKRPSNFPEAIFLYLKKEGYTNKGEIYRIITLDPLVVIIKQNTEYIDLDKFLEDNQNIEPYSDLYSTYQDEKEVVARLDPNFSFEDIHYASSSGMNMNMFLKNLDKNKLKNDILKKDQGKLLSFTKDRDAANDIFYTAINNLEDDEDNEDLEETTNPQSGKAAPYGSGYAPVKNKNLEEDILTEKCWKGYTQKGIKTMFGKKYPNCVKIK